jgi:hypothetical protein
MTTAMPVAQDWPAMLTATRLAGHLRNAPPPAGGCVTLCGLATRHLKAGPVRELGS